MIMTGCLVWLSGCGDRAIGIGYTAPFFYYNILRGYQKSLEDLLLAPEFAHHFIEKISDVFIKKQPASLSGHKRQAQLSQVTDDYGDQNGLLISPRTFSKFFEQPQRRSMELAREQGLFVFHHDDGDVRLLLPKLIDMGINILNPVQWRCGNWDLPDLKQKYGGEICFHSAVDNQPRSHRKF